MATGHTPFAVVNRTANPLLRVLLRSPLHGLLSRSFALITVTGRHSGRQYTFPVDRREGDRVTIGVGWPQRGVWWRNLVDGAEVGIRIAGREYRGHAEARGDERTGVVVEIRLGQPAPGEP